ADMQSHGEGMIFFDRGGRHLWVSYARNRPGRGLAGWQELLMIHGTANLAAPEVRVLGTRRKVVLLPEQPGERLTPAQAELLLADFLAHDDYEGLRRRARQDWDDLGRMQLPDAPP